MSDARLIGNVDLVSPVLVEGWAAAPGRSEPLELELLIDSESVTATSANRLRVDIRDKNLHATGHCGFRFTIVGGAAIPSGAEIVVRDKTSRHVIGQPACIGGTFEEHRPARVNHRGELLSLNKNRSFSVRFRDRLPDWEAKQLEAMTRITDLFREEFHLETALAYGTLLGAVRDNDFIRHDDDVDMFYVSREETLEAVARENWAICQRLIALGFSVQRFSYGQFLTYLKVDGEAVGVEFFSAWTSGGAFFLNFAVAGNVSVHQVLPLENAQFKGRTFQIARDPPALLAALYGPHWKTPDPAFRWKVDAAVKERIGALEVGLLEHAAAWDRFYDRVAASSLPSQFEALCAEELEQGTAIVELGCGTGRDSFFFGERGFLVAAFDFSATAILKASNAGKKQTGLKFQVASVYDRFALEDVERTVIQRIGSRKSALYARLLIDSVREEGEMRVLAFAARFLRGGENLCLEYLTTSNPAADIPFSVGRESSAQFRRLIDHQALCTRLRASGFEIKYEVETRGLAAHAGSDPFVGRIVATRRSNPGGNHDVVEID